MQTDKQFSEGQSRQIAAVIREELARRPSRASNSPTGQALDLDFGKSLAARPFTLAPPSRLEQALCCRCAREQIRARMKSRRRQWRGRAPTASRLFAPRGLLDRRHLPDRAPRPSAKRIRSTPIAPRSPGMRRRQPDFHEAERGSMRPSRSSASRGAEPPDTFISSPSGTVSTG